MMTVMDKRCCGSGTCIINEAGECWCGQKWDGNKMIPRVSSYDTNQNSLDEAPFEVTDNSKLSSQH
jgi:hypothetical protein